MMHHGRRGLPAVILGDAPELPRVWRLALVLFIVALGFICYYFRVVHAHTFGIIGFSIAIGVLLARRVWWERHRPSRSQQ
jgi:hypothetical protein